MIRILPIFCLLLANMVNAQEKISQSWVFVGGDSLSTINVRTTNEKLYLPFIDSFVEKAVFDSLIEKAGKFEEQISKGVSEFKLAVPHININGRHILYDTTQEVKTKCNRYTIYLFLFSKVPGFDESYCYKIFYIQDIGSILIQDIEIGDSLDHIMGKWNYYKLISYSSDKRSVLKQKELKKIIKSLLS